MAVLVKTILRRWNATYFLTHYLKKNEILKTIITQTISELWDSLPTPPWYFFSDYPYCLVPTDTKWTPLTLLPKGFTVCITKCTKPRAYCKCITFWEVFILAPLAVEYLCQIKYIAKRAIIKVWISWFHIQPPNKIHRI